MRDVIDINMNTPEDFISTICRAADWNGDRSHIDIASGHHASHLTIDSYAAVFRDLGLHVAARRCRLDRLTDADLPCLYRTATGRVNLALKKQNDELHVCRERQPDTDLIQADGKRVLVLDVEQADEETEELSSTVRRIFTEQRSAIIAVALTSCLIAVLGLSTPLVVLTVYDLAIPAQSTKLLWSLAELAGVLVLVELSLRLIRAWLVGTAGAQIEKSLSQSLFRKLARLPIQKLHNASMFQQMTRLKQFDSVRDGLTGSFVLNLVDLPFALLFLGVLAFFSTGVAISLAAACLVFGIAVVIVTRWLGRVSSEVSKQRVKFDSLNSEIAQNRALIQTFDVREDFEARAAKALKRTNHAVRRQRLAQAMVQAAGQALVALIGVAAVAIATLEAMSGTLSFGGLIVIVTLVWRVLAPAQALLIQGQRVVGIMTSLRQIDAVLGQEEEDHRVGSQIRSKELNAPIELKNVFLRFDKMNEPALSNISFRIEPGEHVALCGPSRSGKTCLLNCLSKLVVPGSGSILMDGIDYHQLAVDDVRHTVSYCTHDNWFFDMSLRDNMRMGNPNVTDPEILETIERIGATRDLRRFHQGLDTIMNQQFVGRLSTVQLKSLSIARMLCRSSPVYLFDDAMVGLSSTRAKQIWTALDELKSQHTIIAVTNRIEQLALADRIICLNKGRVVINGSGEQDAHAAAALIQGK